MVPTKGMLAIATAIMAVSGFSFMGLLVRPAAAANALTPSATVISFGGSVALKQTIDAPATGTVTNMTVIRPDGTVCALHSGGAAPFSVLYPSSSFFKISGFGTCNTNQGGIFTVNDKVAVELNSFSFIASFQTQFQVNVFVPPPPPIPAPSSCTYAGHPTSPLSQTTVAIGNIAVTKHAEKEIYDCIISGSTKHYILDTTVYTTIRQASEVDNATGGVVQTGFTMTFVECAKDRATATAYSCQTEAVGNKLATTSVCEQLALGFPQEMNTVVVNGVARTFESQKEIFKCNTPNGQVIQEVIIWTNLPDYPGVAGGENDSQYAVETCQKPATITTGLPLLNCQVTGPVALIG